MMWYLILFLTCNAGALVLPTTRNNESIWNEYLLPAPGICRVSLSDRILGGEKTAINAFPWAAIIGAKCENREPFFFCGGSLISDRFVLTAEHCFLFSSKELIVRLGEWDIASENDCIDGNCSDKPIDYDVDTFQRHEDHHNIVKWVHNDIAH